MKQANQPTINDEVMFEARFEENQSKICCKQRELN